MSESTKTIVIGAAVFLGACIVVGCIAVFLLIPTQQVPSVPAVPSPVFGEATPSAWYQVYFTSPKYPDKESEHRGGIDDRLTALINSARTSVDMAIYQLDLADVTQAHLAANKRGAMVRIVADIDILDDSKENPSFLQLQKAGIKVVGGNPNAIMHDKFVVVDGTAVWTGSWNFTDSDTYRYNNNGIVIRSPELAHNYAVTFEKMFADKKFGKVFIVDNNTVVFGSFNFSASADEENDENLLMISDPSLAAQFEAEFARVYNQAKSGPHN